MAVLIAIPLAPWFLWLLFWRLPRQYGVGPFQNQRDRSGEYRPPRARPLTPRRNT